MTVSVLDLVSKYLYRLYFQLLQYKQSSGQDGDKPKENGTVPSGSPEQNGEQQQTKVKALATNIVTMYAFRLIFKIVYSFKNLKMELRKGHFF